MTVTIHETGPAPTDWSLVVTDDGDVAARKSVPYDGVLSYSTEDRPNSPRKRSRFQLSVRTVVAQYCAKADPDVGKSALHGAVDDALYRVREGDDA
jgi:hypothetical protein